MDIIVWAGWPAKTYIYQLGVDIECDQKDIQRVWQIGINSERVSGESMPLAHPDDEDDDEGIQKTLNSNQIYPK